MKCPDCGNDDLQEHHRFCSNCGCKLTSLQSTRETVSESTNSSQQAQSVKASDAAGVQTSTETVEVVKRSSSGSLAGDQEAEDESVKTKEKVEKFEGVHSDEIYLSESRKCFGRSDGVETDAVHPFEGKKVVEKSEDADGDAVYPREDKRYGEKSSRAENNVAHPRMGKTNFEGLEGTHSSEMKKDVKKSKCEENEAIHLIEEENDVEKPKCVKKDVVNPKQGKKEVEVAESNSAHLSEENIDIERPEGPENDAAHSSEGEIEVEKPGGAKNDAAHPSEGQKDVEKPKCVKKDVVNPKQGKKEVEGAESNSAHLSEENIDIERPEGPENDAAHSSEGEIEVDKPGGAKNDAAHPSEGQKDVEKLTGLKDDAVGPNDGQKDLKKAEGVEGGAAHPKEANKDVDKSKDPKKEAVYPSEEEKDVQKSNNADDKTAHHNEEKKDEEKPTGAENDKVHVSKETKDIDESTGAEDNAAHPSKGRKDVDKSTGGEDNTAHISEEKKDVDKTKGAEKEALHFSGRKKDIEQTQGAKSDAVHFGDGKRDTRNSGSSRDVESMTVIFHALLTPTFNINFQRGDKVVLRGGSPFSWKHSGQHVEMHPERQLLDGKYLLKGEAKLSMRQASGIIPYKYVVIPNTGRTANDKPAKDLWECLIDLGPFMHGKHVNRCLRIPDSSIKSNGTWHQYDDAIFSQPGFWDSIRSYFPHWKNDAAEGRRLAMIAMLPEWERISLKEGGLNAHDAFSEINSVVHCMSKAEIENGGHYYPRIPYGFDFKEVLCGYLSPQINRNIQTLQVHTDDKESQGRRLVTSAMIASIAVLHQIAFLGDDQLKKLLECLLLDCSEYDALLRHFPKKQHLRTLADSLWRLCTYVIEYRRDVFHWLFAMPLLHFLSDSIQPFFFETLTLEPSSVQDTSWWGTQGLEFQSVRRQAAFSSNSSPVHLLHQLSPMFKIDPLFARTFLLTLPLCDIAKVLQRKVFPLHEVCWTLARVVEERPDHSSVLLKEQWESLEKCIQEMNDSVAGVNSMELSNSQYEAMTSVAKAALHLLRHLLTVNELVIRKRFQIISGIFKLLDQSLLLAKRSLSTEETASEVKTCNEIFQAALRSLHDSLEKHFRWNLLVVSTNWRNDELQAWSHLLWVKLEDIELQQFWERGVKQSLNSRIYQADHKDLIELFCTLDLSAYHQDISKCFESAAFEAVEHLLKAGIAEEPMASLSSQVELSSLTPRHASGVGRLFSLFLKSCWPEGGDGKEIPQDKKLQHILSWKPMAQYFNYFGCGNQLKKMLSHDGLEILVSATSLLAHVGRCLRNGEIQVKTLRIVQKGRDSFLKLFSLLSEEEDNTTSKEEAVTRGISEHEGNKQETSPMKTFLDMRIEELEAFEKEREAVSTFIEMCSVNKTDVDFQGIKEKLEKDLASCQMHGMCHKRGPSEEPIVKFFDLSTKNKRMIQMLHLVQPSGLFRDMWQQCIPKAVEFSKDKVGSSGTLTVDLVQELLWTPAYGRWRSTWERILAGEITLQELDKRFVKFRNDPKTLEIEIGAVVACFSDQEDIDLCVRQRVAQIKQYHKLREFEGAATAILKFQKAMDLQGDFDLLHDFCGQLNEEFLRRPLCAIGDDVFEIAETLERLPQPMIECLKTVGDCKEYIFWLRKEVNGREEVKTLVDLAMMSAGESDIETDRVSCLHTTALGFAPFIFDLEKCDGFSQLTNVCERVWEEIKGNNQLPVQLRDISRHLEWLKGVKDAHAMSSLKLAQAINERGVYCVGKLDSAASTQPYDKKSVDSVISLLLPPSNVNGEAREFSLEKLKELQSKLALISGKRSHGQDDVEKFGQLLQGVIQLGQAYVNLCEIGDVSHLDWSEEYKCKSVMGKNVMADIESKCTEFERCFSACKEHIHSLRMKYHELNYFTIQQLLFLRKELAGLKQSATMNSLHLQVYALLEKVLPGLHRSSLQTALLDVGIFSRHLDDDNYSDDAASRNASEQMPSCNQEREDQRTGDEQLFEKYELLLNYVEKINYPEPDRLAVAALVENSESSDAELLLWCFQNHANSDRIDELYDKASDDPSFRGIVNQDAESDLESSQSSQDSDDIHESLTEEGGERILDSRIEDITLDETKGGTYLSLDEIGVFLSHLANNGERAIRRKFPSFLRRGKPNLILAHKEHIFAAILGLYMDEKAQSLPNCDEVLICSSDTTSEEVELLWRRALSDNGENLYCLVNGDLLDYDVSQKVVDCLHTLMQDYRSNESLALVVLCSRENEERAHIVTSLERYKVEGGMPRYPRPDELRRYLEKQFKAPHPMPGLYCEQHVVWSAAAEVGRAENLNVHVVTSDHPGVGKSLVVQRVAEQLSNLHNNRLITEIIKGQDEEPPPLCVTIPLHDKRAGVADVVGFFLPHALHSDIPLSRIFHMDRSATVTPEVETLLFNLLILGEITDDRGRVWRRNPYDLYILEITDPVPKEQERKTKIFKFHELLPSIRCFLPMKALGLLQRKNAAPRSNSPLFDEEELQSEAVQRVWQYLQLYSEDPRLIQHFNFDAHDKRDDSPQECLETLIGNCGVRNPSWSELRYFVSFLNNQLRDCEESVFCKTSLVEDTLEGFRSFVVAFMIIMSKDFSMRSLKEDDFSLSKESAVTNEELDIAPFQLRRRWEGRPHPYIFFNRPNNDTMSFLGFRLDEEGNLLDPRREEIIQKGLMTRHLRTGLHVQKVDFNTDFESYSKPEKIQLLCSVMGMECAFDPDESYELTGDNVKKILAIHMRFRCNIPVVIMGETGCGKTRLIRYLCGLQTEGVALKNLLLMKIHGGTTYKDIERNVLHAEMMALKNETRNRNVDTVLFFDEANTSESLGMIKEIMVDRRCNGRPLSDRLKFIVACNPYRRHTDDMIQKLESAGLGYHVRADETEERLGRIPLRHLVYRVHALPESMRSLVWDFGQLNPEVEELYTRQIVLRYVQRGRVPGDDRLVVAIATVLATSQQFMRNKKDECSFVSLRDVKRAMEVMVWFYENFDNFSPLIHDEDGDGGDKADDDDDDDENEDEEELKEERPRYSKQRTIIEEELFSREHERPPVRNESSSFTEGRPAFKKEPSDLTEERRPSKEELFLSEEAVSSPKEERPTVRRERFPWKEGRPTLKKPRSPLAEERSTIKGERSAEENFLSAVKEELSTLKEKRPILKKARSPLAEERPTIKGGRSAEEKFLSAVKEDLSTLKEKRSILKKARSPRRVVRPTFKDEHPTLKIEERSLFEAFRRSVQFADARETMPPEEPELLHPEEILSAASQENLGNDIDRITWSLILALGVCYQARLRDRDEYRETVAKSFHSPCRLPGGAERIEKEISRCQEALMAQLELGPNIACNAALTENVFMMVVCIELRIPLFVVGKPGSSKSLAKAVVADNMQGENSKSELFRKFKQIQLVSYQCSPQSTPEGILATFQQCSELQESKNKERKSDRFASVVVLDEVGLAEDSPKMPLKTLHPLLEVGNENDEDIIQTEDRFTRVAFIGLSNWALDPAKMNRGIMLCRNEPDGVELEATARGICGRDEEIMTLIEPLISPIVHGYTELYNKQKNLKKLQDGKKDEFFGLRDFYSLLKMVVHIAREEKRRPNWEELEHVIKRNFSGLLEDDFDPVRIIMRHVGFPSEYYQEEEEEERRGLDSVDLIRASLDRKNATGEGRYLLIMTENFAALPRVKQMLLEEDSEEPYVIFGSGFPKDQLFTQVCRNINRVKICMETGRTVILLNLENLYESLYDALNQYYVTFGGEKYVDLGLGNNRVKCRVHKDFRLIVIADKDVVYNKFPIPLINRLEKHFLVMSAGLTDAQEQLSRELNLWVENFAEIFQPAHETKKRRFTKGDAFIGYHEDSVPAVVLQVCGELHDEGSVLSEEDRESWKENVLKHCQERLLQCATPDSVTRLPLSRLRSQAGDLWTTYFREQEHSSLANFLDKALSDVKSRATSSTKIALRAQISTHSRLLSERDIPDIAKVVDLQTSCVKCVSLQQFQTEQQFCNCIGRDFWARLGGTESLLIVQCDSSDKTLDLVACSRHLLIEECREMEKELDPDSTGSSHILMIVQLSRVSGGCSDFVGVQGEDWLSVHIDELCPPSEEMPAIEALVGRSVSKIFERALHQTELNLSVSQILSSCVQEAASRIEDDEATLERATKRIELLLKLLTVKKETGEGRFELVLADRLHQLLQEKDQRAPNQGDDWLQAEALNGTMNETGTFKKALWRRFLSVVAPILAEVIAYVDRDGNLELAASGDTWVFNLWLKIFGDSSLSELSFDSFMSQEGDIPVVRSKVPVSKSGHGLHAFQSTFPFSWLLKQRVDELYREARSIAANSHENVTECLRGLLSNSEVNSVVSEAITEGGGETVVACYLLDFTHMVYKPRFQEEVEVVQKAITAAAKEIHHSTQSPGESFTMDLALVHVAHSRIQWRLNCLSLLLQTKPDIVQDLLKIFSWDENEMTIDAIALQMCLERMEPCVEDVEDTSRRQAWCDIVLSVKIPVEEMISKSSAGGEARIGEKTESIITQCRCMWQRLSAVRMFIEQVYPYQDKMDRQDLQNILTLSKALGDRTDFSKRDSLIIVERFLVRCSDDSIQRSRGDRPEDHQKFLQRCNAFFMEIVSVFCFGEDVRDLDADVFDMLMGFVTGSQSSHETKEFSPFPEFGMDSSPVVRSFLLQQLINSSDEKAKKHLERYLYGVQGLSSEVPHILNVCLLAVQCMENSWISSFSKNANLELAVNIGLITKLCQDALRILNEDFTSFEELRVDSLEAVAKARYILGMTAEYLYMSCVSDDEKWVKPETRGTLELLFTNVKALCTSGHSRSPALYLLKQLVKRYGGHSIATISQNEDLSWIVPTEFQRREDDGMTLDRFLVYGVQYREVRDSLARAILSGNTDELIASLEALRELPGHAKDIVILLALYREVIVPQGMWARNQLDKCALVTDTILKRGIFLSTSARNFAKNLLKNSQGVDFPFLSVQDTDSVIENALPEILFHVKSVLQCIDFDGLLQPLKAIIFAPSSMLDSFLPTMPEDSFGETISAISEGGNWYECPAGHRYFVGDCGRPTEKRDCPWCESGVAIGGEEHQLVSNNKLASRQDRSSAGHILGAPQRIIAERDLSPANVSLLRVILHSAMLAGAYQQPEVVSQLMHPDVPTGEICRFLWEHLVNDVRNVSISLERSEDEVLLLIHLVLSEIMSRSTIRELDYNGKWSTKAGRKEWENEFVNVFARPICTNLEERLQDFYGLSVNDRRLGNDPLMREIYEVNTPPPARTAADIHPGHAAFWKHRTRVTVEHIIRQFQDVKSNVATCKVLGKFLAEEHSLRAVRYLPDILALLSILTDRFHRRIDREKANQLKIRELLQEFPKGQKENVRKLFQSVSAAWDQVRLHLSSQGRFAPTKEQCSQSIEMSSTASVLLPGSAETGVCSKGLLFFLVNVHNELVQTYCNAVKPNGNSRTAAKIPLSEVSMSQLIAYDSEKDLLPVMLANCSYSLEVGKETQLQYNWETLEKQIIDRFIRGRPLVHFELDDFMFREDARDYLSFEQLRTKIPQEPIQGHIRTQILSELKDLRDVSDLRSMLDTAVGFLSRAGGNPQMKISDYLKTVLLVSEGKSSVKTRKVQQSCSLNNILDLWSTLTIVRADLLLKNDQDPFEEVPEIFKTEMPRDVMIHFSSALRKVNIELFLSKVVEVISLWLPQEGEQTGEMRLDEYLDGKVQYEEEIPEDVCVKHVIYAWQLALQARERDQGRRRSMMS